ncbi:MAG: tRNA (adenosine(37)-N6)-threonylcarbamoyltransferase complex transferase subunit TsaD [Candidatus Woesebacteria bacterium]|nr:tRNA (adenosine(37)-N6)-threonylcarbamoyltransferase complex transferase subunit TsaD [Candidatus Woesebacteria bacterium]
MGDYVIILAIDTSCDETAAAVTRNSEIVSSVIWSQSSLHASFGGVIPSLAQRQHQERIDWVVERAIKNCKLKIKNCDAIAVTTGPGLAIALGVGINKARELAIKYKKPLIPINHIEAHLLSPFVNSKFDSEAGRVILNSKFPMFGLVLSGGTTVLCLVKGIGDYEMLAETADDALGEALDKAARLLGLGYPGGAILEKFARSGNPNKYNLPFPLQNDKVKNRFSYSGLKTAFVRLFEGIKNPTKEDISDLAASFQSRAFDHILKVLEYHCSLKVTSLLFGGGVANNIELKKRLRKLCKKHGIKLHVPYTNKLNGDNAAMIGVTAYLKNKNVKNLNSKYGGIEIIESIDRNPKLKL